MSSSNYILGTDVLAGVLIGIDPSQDKAISIHYLDPAGLVKDKGGSVAGVAYKVAPVSIENKVYDETRKQFIDQMRAQNIAADIKINDTNPNTAEANKELYKGIGVGAVSMSALLSTGYGIYYLGKKLLGH